jgi:hypothetical protein
VPLRQTSSLLACLAIVLVSCRVSLAQQVISAEPLVIENLSLPKGLLRQEYHFNLRAKGGISPLAWEVTSGSLPEGITLSPDGVLSGVPTETGEFVFRVTITDSDKPPRQKTQELTLLVIAPLRLQWSRPPAINGQKIEFAIKLSNETGEDFDLTLIAVAVNEIGRATAVGYQRFTLRAETDDIELPFSENLSPGTYELDVDAVAEIPARNTIYRSRLVTREKLVVVP